MEKLKRSINDGSYLLDAKDRTLLSVLQENAALSLSELGKKVGLSKMAVLNRMNSLRKAGIIEGSYYKINAEKVGQDYSIITRIICAPKGPEQSKIASAISELPGVQSVYLIFGTFDILMIARRKNRTSAKELIYDISKIQGVRNTVTMIPHTIIKESLLVDTLSDK